MSDIAVLPLCRTLELRIPFLPFCFIACHAAIMKLPRIRVIWIFGCLERTDLLKICIALQGSKFQRLDMDPRSQIQNAPPAKSAMVYTCGGELCSSHSK